MKYSGMEDPDTCTHPVAFLTTLKFDLLNRPYRICNRCGTEFTGTIALERLAKIHAGIIEPTSKEDKCHN